MADTAEISDDTAVAPPKRSIKGLAFGLLGGIALGGAGFYAIYSGLADPAAILGERKTPQAIDALDQIGFVPMEPIVVTLPLGGTARHLRFVGQLEVVPDQADEVVSLMPRIVDVLNTYLRAVEVRDLEAPAATTRLRAQMLRRIQVVVGEGRVRDLLITEFVLN